MCIVANAEVKTDGGHKGNLNIPMSTDSQEESFDQRNAEEL